jgi:surfactin family lipopeptide synthetase A
VKRTCLDAYAHQDTPFEKIVEAVRPQRNRAISPLFQVMLVLQNLGRDALPASMQPYEFEHAVSQFDLSLEFIEQGDALAGTITYNCELFTPARIQRMGEHLRRLCEVMVETPASCVTGSPYLSAPEQAQLARFNATQAPFPGERCIHDFFADQVARQPDRVAIVADGQTLSYAQLYARSQLLALYLQAQGVRPDAIVGLYAERWWAS